MPVPALTLALLTAPLPDPPPCTLPVGVATVVADVFARGSAPKLPALGTPGGPFTAQQWQQQALLAPRFGDVVATQQLDRQLGRR